MGAFMLGPDFVQWHGFYEMLKDEAELEEMAEQIRISAEVQSQLGIEGSNSDASLPGFESLLAVVSVLGVAFVLLRRKG